MVDRCVLPSHSQLREVPTVSTGNSGTVGIRRLMTTRTIQSRHTSAFWTSNDVCKVTVAIISLLRIVRRGVTVDVSADKSTPNRRQDLIAITTCPDMCGSVRIRHAVDALQTMRRR